MRSKKSTSGSLKNQSAKREQKRFGTRAGTLQDWRGSSDNTTKQPRRPHALRDGR